MMSAESRVLRGLVLSAMTIALITSGLACRSRTAPPPPPAPVSPGTWAVVDGRAITREDVDKAYQRSAGAQEGLSQEELLNEKLSVLENLIVQNILLARAQKLNVQLPASDVDAAYTSAKNNISDDDFQKELTRRHLTPDDMREGIRRDLLTEKLIEQEATSKIAITDQDITRFFDANRAQFNLAEDSYRVAQIVITPVREPQPANRTGDDATTPQAAAAKAQMVMQKLKAGTPFGELAMDYSEDPESAQRGGDLGLMPVSRLRQAPAQLREAVLNAEPGTAKLVSSAGAQTIVLVLGREPAGQRDLSTPGVRDNITQLLRGRKEQLLRTAYLAAARADATVVNYLARRIVESRGNP